jgi:hypothetical protein
MPPFTEKQGQYLAFIYAYTKLNRRPPAEADMQAPCTGWCSSSSSEASFDARLARREASRFWSAPKTFRSCADQSIRTAATAY